MAAESDPANELYIGPVWVGDSFTAIGGKCEENVSGVYLFKVHTTLPL